MRTVRLSAELSGDRFVAIQVLALGSGIVLARENSAQVIDGTCYASVLHDDGLCHELPVGEPEALATINPPEFDEAGLDARGFDRDGNRREYY